MRVGFIGLGSMGTPMARNAIKAGIEQTVYDVRPEAIAELVSAGAHGARSPREVGERAEIVEVAVVSDEQMEEVLLGPEGALGGMAPGGMIVLHSTIHPGTVRRVAEQAQARQLDVLDVNMDGGAQAAAAQALIYMVGGDAAVLERCRPLLAASARQIIHVGPLGMGAAAKLAQQVITVGTLLAVSEGYRLARAAGVDLEKFAEIMRYSGGRSNICEHWFERFARLDERSINNFYQGMVPALALGHDLGVRLPGTALAQQLMSVTHSGE